ncbi:helix-turn-helix domain-containing protein [Streptomyces sp. NBC_01420]|uniref:helix-turn-helix domain-containing protein n=1 Tax=Streptomyces sp. NBC_01420 TaxID=2903858 RepID=UPI003249D21C
MNEHPTGDTRGYVRVTGDARVELRERMARDYRAGNSIRGVAEKYGRCFGTTHALLQEAGVTFRDRTGRPRA